MSTSKDLQGMPSSGTLPTGVDPDFERIEVVTPEIPRSLRNRPTAGKTTRTPTDKTNHKKGAKGPESETTVTEEGKQKKRNLHLKWVAGTMFQEETLSMEYKPSETKRINGVSLT
jgi:hypothetical protein